MTKSYYLTYDQRLTIERMIDEGFKPPVISRLIGIHLATLYPGVTVLFLLEVKRCG